MSRNWVSHTPDDDDKRPQDYSSTDRNRQDPNRRAPNKRSSPCSPPTPYEKFFLPLEDQSEFFLAASHLSSLHHYNYFTTTTTTTNNKSESHASESIRTEEFASIVEDLESITSETEFDDISIERNIYKDDILGILQPSIDDKIFIEDMASKSKKKVKAVSYDGTSIPAPDSSSSTPPTDAPVVGQEEATAVEAVNVSKDESPAATSSPTDAPHYDVVDHVYEGAKCAWAMGKDVSIFNIAILKPFMGAAEGVATKILSVAAGVDSLDTVDKNIKPHLKGIDHDLLDPAILKLWNILGPILGKGDEIVKGMVDMVKKKNPLIQNKSEKAEAV